MGDLRSGNGATPDDGGRHDLPDFPPEWGPVVIPDDASELDSDVSALYRERRRLARQNRLRGMLGRPPRTAQDHSGQSITMPISIMLVAVLITLASLFVVTWGRGPAGPGAGAPGTGTRPATATAPAADLVDLSLADSVGAPAHLRTYLPAIVLLVDGCDCGRLVTDLAATAPAGATVVVIGHTIPSLPASPPNVRPLADPKGVVTSRYASSAVPGKATAVLLDKPGSITAAVSGVDAASDLTPAQLSRLAAH